MTVAQLPLPQGDQVRVEPRAQPTMPEPWFDHPWKPRAWQAAALPLAIDAVRNRQRAVILAVMGAGKSVLLTEFAYLARPKASARGAAIVVIAPTQDLVRQLSTTVKMRVEDVGQFYANRKEWDREVVVCCYASAPRLAAKLKAEGIKVALLIADECHRTQAPKLLRAVDLMAPAGIVGFSATPFRSDRKSRLQLFDRCVYRYTLGQAIRDGVLVPPRWVPAPFEGDRDQVTLAMLEDVRGTGPGVISADTIADAETFAEVLNERGWKAAAVHSKNSTKTNERLIHMLEHGELDVVVHPKKLSEGVDFPWLRWICLRTKRASIVEFMQEFGRALRVFPGTDGFGPKTEGVILDPNGLFHLHDLDNEPMLGFDDPKTVVVVGASIWTRDDKVREWLEDVPPGSTLLVDAKNPFAGIVEEQARGLDLVVERGLPPIVPGACDLVLAFPVKYDAHTWATIRRAEQAEIEVKVCTAGYADGKPRETDASPQELDLYAAPVGPVEHWARSLCQSLRMLGLGVRLWRDSLEARAGEPTQRAAAILRSRARDAGPKLPPSHGWALGLLLAHPELLTRGATSDLISTLEALRGVPEWPSHLYVPELEM